MRFQRRSRRPRADLSELTRDQRRALETGRPVFDDAFSDQDEMRAAWELYGEVLTAEWITKRPGTRPLAAWLFDLVPQHGERLTTKHWTAENERYRDNWLTSGILHTRTCPPSQESEAEYLDRNGLLTDDERAVLGPIIPATELWDAELLRIRSLEQSQ